jgi:hypothetical protein
MTIISPSSPLPQLQIRASATQSPYPTLSTLLPEGQIDEEGLALLHEIVHPHNQTPVDELPDSITYDVGGTGIDKVALEAQRRDRAARPWWRRPSSMWCVLRPCRV